MNARLTPHIGATPAQRQVLTYQLQQRELETGHPAGTCRGRALDARHAPGFPLADLARPGSRAARPAGGGPDAVSIHGEQGLADRKQAVIDFSDGRLRVLSAKPVIAGSGCNFQRHCHRAVYPGIGFKFNDFIQSPHRISASCKPGPSRSGSSTSRANAKCLPA